MRLHFFKLESPIENILATLSQGYHTIGRGPLFDCNDKRVSREHAAIEITETSAKLISIHVNPCFIKLANSSTITILAKDSSIELNDGDKFAFLPDMYWFRIEIAQDDDQTAPQIEESKEEADTIVSDLHIHEQATQFRIPEVKRELEEDFDEENGTLQKRLKTEQVHIKEETPETSNEEAAGVGDGIKPDFEAKAEPTDPSTSQGNANERRDRCWYGPNCFRKNAQHKSDFSHRGDADYDSDPEDGRPMCEYGAGCYRTSMLHRRQFKHPPGKPASKNKRARTQQATNGDGFGDWSEEEEDPFAVDGDDSDEYLGESDSTDSEL